MRSENQFDGEMKELWANPVFDGITRLDSFEKSSVKILWILKEPNKSNGVIGWNNRDLLYNLLDFDNWRTTYGKVFLVTYGILAEQSVFENLPKVDEEGWYDDINPAESIAVININKGGGTSIANANFIEEEYKRTKELLHKQIDMIDPDVIINGHHLVELLNYLSAGKSFINVGGCKYCRVGKRLIIDANHPNMRGSSKDYFDSIMRAFFSKS